MSYLEFYNLKKEPFHITPDPEFLYLSPSHKEALGVFLYGVRQRKGIIAVTGEVGVGKTTVLRRYLEKIDPDNLKSIYLFNSNISFGELVKLLHEELGVQESGSSVADMVNSLHHALIQQYKEGKNVVLIVDEAQNMPDETLENLRMLSNLETAKDKLLQIVLIGQPELDEKLTLHQLRQLKQRIAVRATIRPLKEDESSEYIQSRLRKCSDSNQRVFSDGAIHAIVKEARGIPRTINILCDNALITGYGYEQKPISRKIIKEVISDFRGNLHPKRKYSLGWIMGIFLFLLALSGIAWMMELTPTHFSRGGNTPRSESLTLSTSTRGTSISKPGRSATTQQGASLHVKSENHVDSQKGASLPPPAKEAVSGDQHDRSKKATLPRSTKLTERNQPLRPANSLLNTERSLPGFKPKKEEVTELRSFSKVEESVPLKTEESRETPEVTTEAANRQEPSKSEEVKKIEIAKQLEIERGRKIQLLLQAQQLSAIEAAGKRLDPDSTQDRVDSTQVTQPPVRSESADTLRQVDAQPAPATSPSNQQSVLKQPSPPVPKRQPNSSTPETVAQPEIRPVLTQIVSPIYPLSFRGRNVEGSVLLSVLVSQRGDVEAIRIVRGIEGYPDFTSQAINAVRQWKFRPAIDHGVRVKAWVSCPIVFRKN